jgi:hypothetical protein
VLEFAAGDSVELEYALGEESADGLPWYLLVRRNGSEPMVPLSQRPEHVDAVPSRFALHSPEPNPAGHAATIRFDLPVPSPVRLEVFDLLGRRVAELASRDFMAGSHEVTWNLRDLNGGSVPPGIYVCRITAGEFRGRSKLAVRP